MHSAIGFDKGNSMRGQLRSVPNWDAQAGMSGRTPLHHGSSLSPVNTLMRVDLPAPLAPITATRLFSVTARLAPSTTFLVVLGYLQEVNNICT